MIERGDAVVITGAAGFIGSAVARAVRARGGEVRAVVEPGASTDDPVLEGAATVVCADVAVRGALDDVLRGARYCVHTAARYAFWPKDPEHYYRTNVEGSREVVGAAWRAGVERVCYTSSVATIGLQRTRGGGSADEDDYAHVEHLFGNYKRSKYVAEHEVLRLAAEGAPVVLAHPTFPVGPGDRRPTPTGKLVVDFLNARIPAYVDTTLNVVHVDDLAEGHLLALERGRQGRSYVLGGENLEMRELLGLLAGLSGREPPTRRVPAAVSLGAAWLSDAVEGRLLGREPHVPLEGARMSATHMRYDDRRAREELGYRSRPAVDALRDAVAYFVDGGYVDAAHVGGVRAALATAG